MKLRPYQERAVENILRYAVDHVAGRLLCVMPPGAGKTPTAAHVLRVMAADYGKRGLVLAHRREIIDQTRHHLIECGIPEHMIATIVAGSRCGSSYPWITVASIDSLRRREKPSADIVVSDEAHHDAAPQRQALRALYPNAFHLGLTATPNRLDGKPLRDVYDELIVAATPSDLIREGYLVAPEMWTVPAELLPDVRRIRTRRGDYDIGELSKAANKPTLIGGIVDHWLRRAGNRRTLVFAVSVAHSNSIVARFRHHGIEAEHIDGSTPHRDEIVGRLRRGSLRVVSSCMVFSEGIDLPSVKCVVMARPTQSLALSIQQAGRCMRPFGNDTAMIIDYAGNLIRHGAPHEDRSWSLNGHDHGVGSAAPLRACSFCFALIPSACLACPHCGSTRNDAPEPPHETPDDLVKFCLNAPMEEIDTERKRIEAFAAKRNLPKWWVSKMLVAKYGKAAHQNA